MTVQRFKINITDSNTDCYVRDIDYRELEKEKNRLIKELKEANYLIAELNSHEGAEGWSDYLNKRLDKWIR